MSNKLRTLKDIPCSDNDEFGCCNKEITGDNYKTGPHAVEVNSLRQEAIKLIKKLKEYKYMEKDGYCLDCNVWFEGIGEHEDCLELDNFCETSDVDGAIKVLKYFFNITEEELK